MKNNEKFVLLDILSNLVCNNLKIRICMVTGTTRLGITVLSSTRSTNKAWIESSIRYVTTHGVVYISFIKLKLNKTLFLWSRIRRCIIGSQTVALAIS